VDPGPRRQWPFRNLTELTRKNSPWQSEIFFTAAGFGFRTLGFKLLSRGMRLPASPRSDGEIMFGKAVETVEVAPQVSPAERLEQIRERRRAAEQNFNRAFRDVANHRAMLAKSIARMEAAKRVFHFSEEEESTELMRQGLIR
jgi:hypothetical protein